ncbi:MAG: hypothetical protein RJA33_20 [Actinomycetota bacterium]|jgi:hypothetical protein
MNKKALKVALFEFQNQALRKILEMKFLKPDLNNMVFIGNNYSGYWFPENLIYSQGTIWGIGLGFDSSFEEEMLKNGYKVLGFEPEASCYRQAKIQLDHPNATVYNFGIWDKSGSYPYTGKNFSLVDIFQKGDFHENRFEIKSLWEAATDLKLEDCEKPRVLRMNIEGAEREILIEIGNRPLPYEVMLFQAEFLFHLPFFAWRKRLIAFRELFGILRTLTHSKWTLIGLNRHQFTLVSNH